MQERVIKRRGPQAPRLKIWPEPGMRVCAKCKAVKPKSEFYTAMAGSDRVGAYCKPCKMARKRADAATFTWTATAKDRARFAVKFTVADSGCHVWHSSLGRHGYGLFFLNGRQLSAHRIAWFLAGKGAPPEWPYVLDHICKNTGCVNVAHLRVVTQQANCMELAKPTPFWKNKSATCCSKGHPYTPENLAVHPIPGRRSDKRRSSTRACLICYPEKWRWSVIERDPPPGARKKWIGPFRSEIENP